VHDQAYWLRQLVEQSDGPLCEAKLKRMAKMAETVYLHDQAAQLRKAVAASLSGEPTHPAEGLGIGSAVQRIDRTRLRLMSIDSDSDHREVTR